MGLLPLAREIRAGALYLIESEPVRPHQYRIDTAALQLLLDSQVAALQIRGRRWLEVSRRAMPLRHLPFWADWNRTHIDNPDWPRVR